jgi:RNA polymerase sigma-70 factor (ECF subfamily)
MGDSHESEIAGALDASDWAAAATATIRGYGPEILHYLCVLLRDRELANDVFADASVRLWDGMPKFRRECSMRTWFYRVAWSTASNARRQMARRREERLDSDAAAQLIAEVSRSAGTVLAMSAENERLRAQLTPEEQTLLTLRLDRGLEWSEVALVLDDVDAATARKRFERLKRKLADLRAQLDDKS